MDLNDEINKAIAQSRELAINLAAEEWRCDPTTVEAVMGEYHADTNSVEWMLYQRGTFIRDDSHGIIDLDGES